MTKANVILAHRAEGLDAIRRQLVGLGHEVVAATADADELMRTLGAIRPDVAVAHLALDGGTGVLDAARRASELGIAVVFVTDGEDRDLLDRAQSLNPHGYVVEPVDSRQLGLAIEVAMSLGRARLRLASNWSGTGGDEPAGALPAEETERLYHRTRLMETVFNSVADALIVTDVEGNFLAINESAVRMVGPLGSVAGPERWPESYGLYQPDGETLFPHDELPLVLALRGEPTVDVPMMLRNSLRPHGLHLNVGAQPLRDPGGTVRGAVLVFRDVSRERHAEARLHQTTDDLRGQKKMLSDILDAISDGIVVANEAGKITVFNPSAERMIGIGPTDAPTEQWTDEYGVFYSDQVTKVPAEELPLVRAMSGAPVDEMEVFVRNPEVAEGAFINVNGRPMFDEAGNRRGGVVVFRDVTAHRQADQAVTRAFAQGRLEVLDTLLHNIGNAINSVAIGVGTLGERLGNDALPRRLSALSEALREHRQDLAAYLESDPQGRQVVPFLSALAQDFEKDHDELLGTVKRVEKRIGHIVDIIRTQKATGGSMARKDVALRDLIDDALAVLQESLARRGIEIRVECERAPKRVRVEESQFNQMLVNLVSNSIEAIDERRAQVEQPPDAFVCVAAYEQEDWLALDVIDNGIGIAPDAKGAIFSAGYTTKADGSGLGLHSAANLVIAAGGRIQPISAGVGMGTIMRVLLPMAAVRAGVGRGDGRRRRRPGAGGSVAV